MSVPEPSGEAAAEQPDEVAAEAGDAVPSEADERARVLSLIDFLADYDARKNPPVHDVRRYEEFLLRDADLPGVPGVSLSPAAEAWLSVDFLDLPARPEVPGDLVALLGDSAAISPQVRPEVRATAGSAAPAAADAGPADADDAGPAEAADAGPDRRRRTGGGSPEQGEAGDTGPDEAGGAARRRATSASAQSQSRTASRTRNWYPRRRSGSEASGSRSPRGGPR